MAMVQKLKQALVCAGSSILILTVFLGCTHTIQQSEQFSDAGIRYAEAVDELLQVTANAIIEDDNNMLLYLQNLTSLEDKKRERELLEKQLIQHDKEVLALLETLAQFRKHARMLRGYFISLQALASTDAPESIAKAIGHLSSSINNVNQALEKSEDIPISDAEQEALSGLAGLVSRGVQSEKLQEVLKRDALIIGEQLLLQEKLLAKLSGVLKHSAEKRFVNERKVTVLKPYKSKNIKNTKEWKKARENLLKSTTSFPTLEAATEAARQMRLVWEGILEGKTDVKSIRLLLVDINTLTAALGQLKEADQGSEGGSSE